MAKGKGGSGDKKDNTNKVAQTAKLREARKVRQKKREAADRLKVLRRAADGNVSRTKMKVKSGLTLITGAKGGSQKCLRKMLRNGLLVEQGDKLVPGPQSKEFIELHS